MFSQKVKDAVKTCFEENDILSSDGKPFNPHITMMKLSKGSHKLKKKGIKKFPSDLYTEHVNKFFGPQKSNFSTLTSVQCHSLEEVSTFIVHACVQSAMEQVQSEKYKEIAQKLDTSPKGSITQSEKVVKKTKCINNSNKNVKKTEKEKVSKNSQQTGNEKVSENVQKTKNSLDTEHKKVSKNVKKTENKKVLKKGGNVGNEKVSKNVQKARNEKVSENVQEAGNGKVCANVQKY
ncbi:hypothetical protein KUTeg_016193 [Tegillarca granosa]|uniref:A-kinase anchor protein 7-like phosphoesterase domain-containing protein n=1 Tax=Tegillarca granosa TaxID=220873 RepID=A0ABQ9EK52_TEGGR|nr:hypothetical protein KUTeg_016193 [Tegillarca granosa]